MALDQLLPRRVRFLRSSLFVAFVSLFVFTGYGVDVFGDCCGRHEQEQADHGDCAPDHQNPDSGDGCQCICHVSLTPLTAQPVWVADAVFITVNFVAQADEFPPDAVPLGIDHPPQIG